MDKEYGLPSLKDKSFDLCLTDPPWGIDINHNNYIDNYDFEWQIKWFEKIENICNGLVLICGYNYFYDWICYKKPSYLPKFWYRSNTITLMKLEPILGYGKIKNWSRIRQIFEINIELKKLRKWVHTSPKYLPFIYYIIKKLKPLSVIDPFLGSGTTAEVCTKLGIPFLGYEIKEEYKHDIDLRLKNCKKEPQQVSILQYNNGVKT